MLRVHLQRGNVPDDKDVGRAFSCKLSGGGGERVRTTTKAIGEKKLYRGNPAA